MSATKKILLNMYDKLFKQFGPQNWWPAESLLEMMIGAVLTQNTAWSNVEIAIENLKKAKLLQFDAIKNIDTKTLSEHIKPTGYFNQKAKSLENLFQFLKQESKNDINEIFSQPLLQLRAKLLEVKGIGFETADSILLYGGDMPIFVIDAYTKRIFKHHGLILGEESYESIRLFVERNLPQDPYLFQEFHALIVKAGANNCKSSPKCDTCPLQNWRNFFISEESLPYNKVCINATSEMQ